MSRQIKLLSIIVLITVLTGCWDRKELNKVAIVSALAVDVGSSPGTVFISAQVIRPGDTGTGDTGASGGGRPFGVISVEAPSIFEAIRKATLLSSRKLFFAHCEVIVFGEAYAKQGIRPAIDFFMRDQDIRPDTKVIIAIGEAREVIHSVTQFERVPGLGIWDLIEASTATSMIGWARVFDVYSRLLSSSTEPIATLVDAVTSATIDRKVTDSGTPVSPAQGDREKRVRLVGTAVFADDRTVGTLDLIASRGYRWIMDEIESGILGVSAPDGSEVQLEIFNASSKVSAKNSPTGPKIEIHIRTVAGLGAQGGWIDLTHPDELKALESAYAEAIVEEVQLALERAQQLQADIFGFGSAIEQTSPSYWRQIKDQWPEMFGSLTVALNVEPRIKSHGVTLRPPAPKDK